MINMDAANLKVSGLAKSENVDNPLKFKGWIKVPHSSLKVGQISLLLSIPEVLKHLTCSLT